MNVDNQIELPYQGKKKSIWNYRRVMIKQNWQLYVLLFPTLLYFFIFQYLPMYGIQIAFKDFIAVRGITGSPWIGFEHFERFFNSYQFWLLLKNTLGISLYQIVVAFPIPIVLALMINQVGSSKFKKVVQTVTYAPHFISFVVLAGMLYLFLSPRNGLVNNILDLIGIEAIFFMGIPEWFKSVFVFSGIWQNMGWNCIIYLAALTGINPELHEAAVMDGANKLKRVWHIDIPGIMPTIMILLILNVGDFMTVGHEKVLLLQNYLNLDSSEVIQTYVYKIGLLQAQFSYSAAIGLFNNVINFILLVVINDFARRMKQTSLW